MDELFLELRTAEIEFRNKPSLPFAQFNNKRTCVFVVDMINGFVFKGALSSPNVEKIIVPIGHILDFLPESKKIFICDRHNAGSSEFDTFPPHCHTEEEFAVVDGLKRFADKILYKNSVNGIFRVLSEVNLSDFDNFLIVGCCTDICILQLSLSLKAYLDEVNQKGAVYVISDACQTFDAPNHDSKLTNLFAFKCMETNGVKIIKKLI